MIFLGPFYQPENENLVLANSKCGVSNATEQFQLRLLQGLVECGENITILNVLPIGTWPNQYKKLVLANAKWSFNNNDAYEIGSINLPFIKQFQRKTRVKKILSKLIEDDFEILIYSTYLPFLKAVLKLPPKVKVTLIVPDMPEYYDHGHISVLKRFFRKRNTRKIYKCLDRIDRFVLLTEHMKSPLHVGQRPYMVMEGLAPPYNVDNTTIMEENRNKEIIFYAGSLRYKFGIGKLIEAFKNLTRNNVELWVCGIGEATKELELLSKTDSRVRYFGFVSSTKVNELRKHATVLINPRTSEGEYTKYSFPSKTMEYMVSGIPVLMYKLSGIPNEYDDYLMYIEGDRAQDIKYSLEKFFAIDIKKRQEFGRTARDFVLKNKSYQVQARRLLQFVKASQMKGD